MTTTTKKTASAVLMWLAVIALVFLLFGWPIAELNLLIVAAVLVVASWAVDKS